MNYFERISHVHNLAAALELLPLRIPYEVVHGAFRDSGDIFYLPISPIVAVELDNFQKKFGAKVYGAAAGGLDNYLRI